MLNKKRWKHFVAVMMCSALVLSAPAAYAAEEKPVVQSEVKEENTQDNEEQKGEVKEETQEAAKTEGAADSNKQEEATGDPAEADVLPSVLTKNVTFEGKDFELAVSLGSGTKVAKSIDVKINGTNIYAPYNTEKTAITLARYNVARVSTGTYPIEVTFIDNEDKPIVTDTNCTITIPEAKNPTTTPAKIKYDGTKDIVLKFNKGAGHYELQDISSIIFEVDGNYEEGSTFSATKEGTEFTYDLDKGELIIKKEFINKHKLLPYEYSIGAVGKLKTGEWYALSPLESREWIMTYVGNNNPTPEPSNPKHEVTLPKGNTSLPKSEMQNLLTKNQTDDIVLKTPSGVSFTFPKGSMKLIDGKESYDFGAELITDFSKVLNTPFNEDTFAFQINYNYSGELPGNASISIPVDSKWIGQRLYYYRIMDNGTYSYQMSSVVDANGNYTITQSHCSDYVATTQAPDSNGNPTPTPTKTPSTVTPQTTSPKTGDANAMWLYLALMMGAGIAVVIAKRKSIIK